MRYTFYDRRGNRATVTPAPGRTKAECLATLNAQTPDAYWYDPADGLDNLAVLFGADEHGPFAKVNRG